MAWETSVFAYLHVCCCCAKRAASFRRRWGASVTHGTWKRCTVGAKLTMAARRAEAQRYVPVAMVMVRFNSTMYIIHYNSIRFDGTVQEKWSWKTMNSTTGVEGFGIGSSPGLCERFWGLTLNSWSAFTVSHLICPVNKSQHMCLPNCDLSRFGNILHVKGGRRHAEPYHAQVFWTMLCWPCMTMPWSLPQELIVHRPSWQYQFSCDFSMFPWLWAKNIQHLVQQSGLTTDSVYPVKSQQWYRQYSRKKT